MKALGGEEV